MSHHSSLKEKKNPKPLLFNETSWKNYKTCPVTTPWLLLSHMATVLCKEVLEINLCKEVWEMQSFD